ncbi:MAG: hypothetical protein HY319_20535 [Armatimonadetes bacterium]|nr:hypothetical protein [Armatimonadota bacterium]
MVAWLLMLVLLSACAALEPNPTPTPTPPPSLATPQERPEAVETVEGVEELRGLEEPSPQPSPRRTVGDLLKQSRGTPTTDDSGTEDSGARPEDGSLDRVAPLDDSIDGL